MAEPAAAQVLPRALVWDVDGTLAETEHDGHRVAFNQAFDEAGLRWHWDEACYRQLLATTGGKERLAVWWQQVDAATAAAPGTAQRIRALHQRKTVLYTALVARGQVQLRPGVRPLLLAARAAGVRLAIATTTSPDNVQALLQATLGADSPGWFEVVGAGDVVPAKKPAPDIYHWVLDRLGLPAGQCVALEDSAPGVAAALAAGLPTVVTRSRYSRGDALPAAPVQPAGGAGWLLADLDQLGSPEAPARGLVGGQAWLGQVTLEMLRHWCRRAG